MQPLRLDKSELFQYRVTLLPASHGRRHHSVLSYQRCRHDQHGRAKPSWWDRGGLDPYSKAWGDSSYIVSLVTTAASKRMLQAGTWGDEVFLWQVASNILQVDLIIIPCFRESSVHQGLGFTLIKSFERPKHLLLYLFSFSESDFNPAHYISVLPNNPKENVILTYWMEKKPAHDRQFKIFSPSRVIPRQQTGAQWWKVRLH